MRIHYRHIIVLLAVAFFITLASSCVSRVMYEDGEFDRGETGIEDIEMLNAEINQDDQFHD